MKILVVSPYLYPQGSGVGRIASCVINELAAMNNHVVVVSSAKKNKVISINNLKIINRKPLFYFSNTPLRFRLFFDLTKIIKKNDFDFILAFSPVPYYADIAAIVSKISKIPYFLSYNTFDTRREKKFINFITFIHRNLIERFTFLRARRIFINSKYLFTANILAKCNKKLSYVTTGIDKQLFKPAMATKQDYILYVGPLNSGQYWKGVNYLVQAIKILSRQNINVQLKIVGSGNRVEYYQLRSKKLGIENVVEFLGYKSNEDLVYLYQNCKFLVLPSFDRAELVPTAITEAFACQKTVVSTKCAGIPYLVQDGIDGLLVEPKNSTALAVAITKLWNDEKLRQSLENNAFSKASSFSWNQMAQDIIKEIKSNLKI